MVLNTSCTMTGASPMDGSSSSITLGRAISARPMASICCSPPESVPAELAAPVAQAREELVDAGQVRRGAAPEAEEARQPHVGAEQEVVLHRERRRTPCGPPARAPARAARCARPRAPGRASRRGAPGRGSAREQAGDGAHGGGLAGAVRADERHHRAAPSPRARSRPAPRSARNLRGDPRRRASGAPPRSRSPGTAAPAAGSGGGPASTCPRYASITFGWRFTSSGVPSAMSLPPSSAVTTSHSCITTSMWCSMRTMLMPRCWTRRMISTCRTTSGWARPAAGSSRMRTSGFRASARAISRKRWAP